MLVLFEGLILVGLCGWTYALARAAWRGWQLAHKKNWDPEQIARHRRDTNWALWFSLFTIACLVAAAHNPWDPPRAVPLPLLSTHEAFSVAYFALFLRAKFWSNGLQSSAHAAMAYAALACYGVSLPTGLVMLSML
jgi:hypothetical protein